MNRNYEAEINAKGITDALVKGMLNPEQVMKIFEPMPELTARQIEALTPEERSFYWRHYDFEHGIDTGV